MHRYTGIDMSSINWQNLRSWNGSQHSAFEELCCQLASYEKPPSPGSIFIRKGVPDAGVECFWRSPNSEEEWAWQAKFFFSIEESQWKQLDESVKTALGKHPNLTSYTICLPLDRQDPRIKKQKWFMDKWNERVHEWENWAQARGRTVSFLYWGEHEILERLTREEHRGRYLFWFRSELFSQNWFESRLDEAIGNAGERYTPELNVELPVAQLFDGLGRTTEFFNQFKILQGKIKKSYSSGISSEKELSAIAVFELLREKVDQLLAILNVIDTLETDPIDFKRISNLASEAREKVYEYIRVLGQLEEKAKKQTSSQQQTENNWLSSSRYSIQTHKLYSLAEELTSLEDAAQSNEVQLANIPALLLRGIAGQGKTHLLCDIAQNRIREGLPTVLLLGEHFNGSDEPWLQVTRLLRLSCTAEEFLGALETAAQTRQSKALIFIDALNEGEGKKLWKKHLAGMLTLLDKFPHLGIAFSVRTPYENVVIPQHLGVDRLIRKTHHGFAQHEYQATRIFFDHYGIKSPSVPLLNPEFQNPLFLKLFCRGLQNYRWTEVPPGFYGISAVFNFLIESVNAKLASEEYLDFDEKSRIVQKAVQKLAEVMAENNKQWLLNQEAQVIVNKFLPREGGYHNTMFRHLVVEGIIAENCFWQDDEPVHTIRFSYERFSDHLIVKYLLDKYLDSENPSATFLPNNQLGELLKDDWTYCNRGLVEAFSIQVPERIRKELIEVAPHCANYSAVRDSFIQSLIWRDPNSITEATNQYINSHIIKHKDSRDLLLDAFLTVASNSNHPYNADFLHQRLKRDSMPDRDAWWSTFLHFQYGQHEAVDRLVDWAWIAEDKSHIEDEAIRLCAITLAWFLTTSNRFLRDRATKALVSLLTPRIHILRQVISQFRDVDDWYILERLYAVAYGCAMRSIDDVAIAELAQDVYSWVFENGKPIPHILLRDYARGVIELALSHNISLQIDVARIRPPYKSEWLSHIPSDNELKIHTDQAEKALKEHNYGDSPFLNQWRSVFTIQRSVLGGGDFARYVIGTNSSSFSWSSRRLDEPPTQKEIYESFLESLTVKQERAWNRYRDMIDAVNCYRQLSVEERIKKFEYEYTEQELEEAITETEQSLRKALGKKKTQIFEESVRSYSEDSDENEYRFDLSIAQRWIFWRVFDLGWTVERFGGFDSRLDSHGRAANKPERIGKKYQWLAYHEFLARVSDNFKFRKDEWNPTDKDGFVGTWQGYERNIDPSCLLKSTKRGDCDKHNKPWWFAVPYDSWNQHSSNVDWLQDKNDLPAIEPIIDIVNPKDGTRWLALENHSSWDEPVQMGEDDLPKRQIWYMLKSYLVHKEDIDCIYDWAVQQNFMGRWMPESHGLSQVFLGEFFWSPAFEYHNTSYFSHNGWTDGDDNKIPKKVLVTTDRYIQESFGFDCSVDESYNIYLPAQLLADQMKLRWNGVEGFFEQAGRLIAFDPSVREVGPMACLINREALLEFLDQNGYDILWTFLGEKIILNGNPLHARLELSGALRLKEGHLEGIVNFKLNPRKSANEDSFQTYTGKFTIPKTT